MQKVAQELAKSLPLIKRWGARHDWVARAQAYDDFLEMERLAALEEYERARSTDLARRRENHRYQIFENEEKAAQIEAAFLQQLSEMPLVTSRATRYEDGRAVEYVIEPAVSAFDLSAKRLHEIATKNEPAKVDMKTCDLSQATDEQLQRIASGEDPASVLGLG